MNHSSPKILDVVENDMCIACGACVYACPFNVVVPNFNEYRGGYEVAVTTLTNCQECAAPCDDVCPSVEVDFRDLIKLREFSQPATRPGEIRSTMVGYSPLYQTNGVSSSGGVVRALVADALERGQPVICLGKVEDEYGPLTLYSSEELGNIPGSIYHSTSFTNCIQLLRDLEQPCWLVAIPCQLEGILKYIQTVEPALNQKIDLIVGLICGWMYSHHSLNAFAQFKGIADKVTDAGYRGEDKRGLLKLKTLSGEYAYKRVGFATKQERLDYQSSFYKYTNRLRCRTCENHVNILADIAVGDAWLKRNEFEKLSLVLVRTERGEKSLLPLIQNGRVVLEEGRETDLVESQSANLVYGEDALKFSVFLASRDISVTPKFIFDTPEATTPILTVSDVLLYKIEIMMRYLVRKKLYKLYRLLFYFVINFQTIIKKLLS